MQSGLIWLYNQLGYKTEETWNEPAENDLQILKDLKEAGEADKGRKL